MKDGRLQLYDIVKKDAKIGVIIEVLYEGSWHDDWHDQSVHNVIWSNKPPIATEEFEFDLEHVKELS